MTYRYKSTFTTTARVIAPSDQDRFEAKASLLNLKGIIPDGVRPEDNPDLLYIAANGATAAMKNRNDDAITAETALRINGTAKHKFISTEHERTEICGFILDTGFTRMGTNEALTMEEATALKEPFNMSVFGLLWKVVNPMVTKYIQKSGDSTDGDVLSLSWEIGFDRYLIGVGSKNLFDARIIESDNQDFAVYDKILRANGGEGRDRTGNTVFRIISGDPVILGYSIVGAPAAEVKGILPITKATEPAAKIEELAAISANVTIVAQNGTENNTNLTVGFQEQLTAQIQKMVKDELLSQSRSDSFFQQRAKTDSTSVEDPITEPVQDPLLAAASTTISQEKQEKNITPSDTRVNPVKPNTMDIKKLSDIVTNWPELQKMEATASVALITEAIRVGSEEYIKNLEAEKALVKNAQEAKAAADQRAKELELSIAEVNRKLEELTQRAVATEQAAKYQERMASFEEEFELDDEDRQIIASQIKDLDDAGFESYAKSAKKLMSGKAKKAPPFGKKDDGKDKEDDQDDDDKKDSKASDKSKDPNFKEALASAKDGGSADSKMVNGVHVDATLLEQMKEAFGSSFKVDGKPVLAPAKK